MCAFRDKRKLHSAVRMCEQQCGEQAQEHIFEWRIRMVPDERAC